MAAVSTKSVLSKGKIIFIALAIILIVSVMFQSAESNQDKKDIADLVKTYEQNFIEVLKDQDLSRLKPYITEKQFKNLDTYLNYYKQKHGVREVNDLLELKMESTTLSDQTAVVNTLEVWHARFEDPNTHQIADQGESFYKNTYNLVKKKGKWYVDLVRLTEVRKK